MSNSDKRMIDYLANHPETPGKPAPEPVPPSEPYPDQPPAEGDES